MPRLGLSQEEVSAAGTLEEVDTMLAEKIDRWNRELREKSLQEGLQEGLQKGLQKGLQEGLQEGEARFLLRQLRLKFGPLESEVEELVRSADADRLLRWGERILTAESLQDVFRG
jgi:flagellar biosynthesis/type III secretory pathway protein FliH